MVGRREVEQVFGKIEGEEGVPETVGVSDYVTAQDIEPTVDQQFQERNVGKASFSQDIDQPGRTDFSLAFALDLIGSGSISTAPDFGRYLRACGFREQRLSYIDLTNRSGIYEHGELLNDGLGWDTYHVARDTLESETRLWLLDGVVGDDPSDTITGDVSGATGDPGASVVTEAGYLYTPDSIQNSRVTLTSAGWSGTPPAVGELITGQTSVGEPIAAVVLSRDTSGANEILSVVAVQGRFTDGDTVTAAVGGGTATVDTGGAQTQFRTPSMTLEHLIDGEYKQGSGMRGDVDIALSAGETGRLNFRYQGSLSAQGDKQIVSGVSNVAAASVLRFASARSKIDQYRLAVAQLTYAMQNELVLKRDGNSSHGIKGGAIVDRRPRVTLDPTRPPAALLDFLSQMQNATTEDLYTELGSSEGNRIALWVPAAQYQSVADGDRDKEHVKNLEALMTDPDGSGDNELYVICT